jgi:hypothetical protein
MNQHELAPILKLQGIRFLKALLELEEQRFSDPQFLKGSTFEEINRNFGLFPAVKAYPAYFYGDVTRPKGKKIFVGINPGILKKRPSQADEQRYLQQRGSFEGYCHAFSDFFALHANGLLRYFANIAGFLRSLFQVRERIDWNWLQENVICLDLIPYHSQNAGGLRINDLGMFRNTYFEIFLRLLDHLDPDEPIFFHGFPTFVKYLEDSAFRGAVEFQKTGTIWTGTFADKFKFFGLPFLTRVSGGRDALVKQIRSLERGERGS